MKCPLMHKQERPIFAVLPKKTIKKEPLGRRLFLRGEKK